MAERRYLFTLSDGKPHYLTIQEAMALNDETIMPRLNQIKGNMALKKRQKDGFEPGWQPNINEYVGGRKEYEKKLKEKGLVELGYDYVPKESTIVSNHCASLDFALHAKEVGVELSDNEVDAIASGEYFKEGIADT